MHVTREVQNISTRKSCRATAGVPVCCVKTFAKLGGRGHPFMVCLGSIEHVCCVQESEHLSSTAGCSIGNMHRHRQARLSYCSPARARTSSMMTRMVEIPTFMSLGKYIPRPSVVSAHTGRNNKEVVLHIQCSERRDIAGPRVSRACSQPVRTACAPQRGSLHLRIRGASAPPLWSRVYTGSSTAA